MNETLDGEFQKYSVAGGAYIREHFFGPDPRLRRLVEHLTDDDLAKLRRGGHDYRKVYAAYKAATEYRGAPTVILAQTIKGWTLGPGVEARNITHQAKKLSEAELKIFRDRLELPIPDRPSRTPRTTTRARSPRRSATSRSAAPRSAGRCRSGSSGRSSSPRSDPGSTPSSRPGARPRCRRRWSSPGSCATSSATRSSARGSSRSSPTRRARSGSTRCSRRSGSTPRSASATSRSTPSCVLSYREATRRPGPRGGDHRGRLDGQLHRPPPRPMRPTAWR